MAMTINQLWLVKRIGFANRVAVLFMSGRILTKFLILKKYFSILSSISLKSMVPKFLCDLIHAMREYTDWTAENKHYDDKFLREYSEAVIGAMVYASADIEQT